MNRTTSSLLWLLALALVVLPPPARGSAGTEALQNDSARSATAAQEDSGSNASAEQASQAANHAPSDPDTFWERFLGSCAAADAPPETAHIVWHGNEWEHAVEAIDTEGESTWFDLLGEVDGTSVLLRVRDVETGTRLAVIKTPTGNNRMDAELYAYRLSEFLGFDGLVVPVVPWRAGPGALTKVHRLLSGMRYPDPDKDARRVRLIRQIERVQAGEGEFVGAMKPWLTAFRFNRHIGTRERLSTHPVMRHLRVSGSQPGDEVVTLMQFTRLKTPHGTYFGDIAMNTLARDISNMMFMDALMGQNDRFPGGNVHLRAEDWSVREDGMRRGLPVFRFGMSRVLALDNGAGLRGTHGQGLNDLLGNTEPSIRIERFDRNAVERMRGVARRTVGRYCEGTFQPEERLALWEYLGVDDQSIHRAESLMEQTLEYIDGLERRHGERIWLRARTAAPAEEG